MLLVQLVQDVIPHMISDSASLSWTLEHLSLGHLHLAQLDLAQLDFAQINQIGSWDLGSLTAPIQGQLQGQQFDTDVFRGARNLFNNFIRSGQLWAFLAGIVVGYVLRTVTTYG